MPSSRILLGTIGRPHGVRGLVRVTSYADPPEAIAGYGALSDDHGRRFVLCWRGDDLAEVAEIVDGQERRVADRTAAERLTNTRLFIERDRLPAPDADEFYLADLVGLVAFDTSAARIGEVVAVHDYGAGASLEIARPGMAPLIVPFTRAVVPEVNVARERVVIDPPAEVDAPPSPAAPSLRRPLPRAGEAKGDITSPALRESSAHDMASGEGRAR